ncbi:MAG: PEP/pyruvate-binding domain-containing protein [Bacteroidales bacterium]
MSSMEDHVNISEGYTSRRHLQLLKSIEAITRTDDQEIKPVLDQMCSVLSGEFCKLEGSGVRVIYDNLLACTDKFIATNRSIESRFETFDGKKGLVQIVYSPDCEQSFHEDDQAALDQAARLLEGFINRVIGRQSQIFTRERLKELEAINKTTLLIKQGRSVPDTLREIAALLPSAWQYPDYTTARIIYDTAVFTSPNFITSQWKMTAHFETIDGKSGAVEVFYLQDFPELDEGPFLKEERNLIDNIAGIIAGYLNSVKGREDKQVTQERLKELSAINQTTALLRENKPIEETFEKLVAILPQAWQYPQHAMARITFDGKTYASPQFTESRWSQVQEFETIDHKKGTLEIYYTRRFPELDEGPFLKEERQLLVNLASLITGYLNALRGRELVSPKKEESTPGRQASLLNSKMLLQRFLNRSNYTRDIFHDLMPFKVREILLVATLYDAYSIEREGQFSEHILGEYYHLNLTSVPRITGVSTAEEALAQLEERHFDMVIMMVGADKQMPVHFARTIREKFPYIPVYLLLNNNAELVYFERNPELTRQIDKLFVWNGDSKIFFAMVKHLEDRVNVENDTRVGLVRVILLVEDSVKYYSRYLQLLYSIVLDQTRQLIEDVNADELYKVLKLRARPKILLASDYEEAIAIYHKYRDFMLCVITDVKFKRNNIYDEEAGFKLTEEIRQNHKDLPVIIQSSDPQNSHRAFLLKASFINKESDTLVQDIKYFIGTYLGFGSFVYKDANGRPIATARTLREFEKLLRTIPDDSLIYHARRNHFSLWFMARGEIQIAKTIYPFRLEHFEKPEDIRKFLLEAIVQHRNEQNRGKVIPWDEAYLTDESTILSLASGALGGKGRGIAFINTLIYNFDFHQIIPNINIRAPKTFIIGTDEFEAFMDRNKLWDLALHSDDEAEIRKAFLSARLSELLVSRLRKVVMAINKPLAVRSSGLFEDSMMQPFAGIFETFFIPNNHPDPVIRARQCCDAVKLVFASVFSKTAKAYIEAVNYKIEEERMAVVIQEVVGRPYESYFYPHISGVAQSYNYYPFAHMKPEEGFAVLALGLGRYVVEGEKAYRFSPAYPNLEILTPRDLYKGSQVDFYAVNLKNVEIDLLNRGEEAGMIKLDIDDAERHGNLKHLASVYNPDTHVLTPGTSKPGPRVLNFADILKYNYIPLARTIEVSLDVVKEAMGAPVEIEFAVDLTRDAQARSTFYLLQIKPLLGSAQDYHIDFASIDPATIVLSSTRTMGNGLIDTIQDVIFVDPSDFDKSMTEEMAREIDALNQEMIKEGKQYILIGPGRWGTRDRWIGIPVAWPMISNAKVIVETALEDFPLDASSGSHFFHNVTSMQVGYFSIQHINRENFINYDILNAQPLIGRTRFFRHVRFDRPLLVKMDGKKRQAIVQVEV